jgi:MFS family permease
LSHPSRIAATEPAAWPHRGYAWYVVVMLMLAYAFSIVDRIGLALLVQPIEADLHISDTQMGLLQGLAFAVFYTVLGLPIGFLADRMNRRWLITIGITAWSAATIACGLARGFAGLFAARIGVGAGEATLNPAGTSMIADYFPPDSRSKAYGVYTVGTSLGSGMAFLLGGAAIALAGHLREIGPDWLTQLAPWKIVFFLIGAPGLLVGAVFAVTVREPRRRDRAGLSRALTVRPLLALISAERRVYACLIGAAVLNFISIYALVGWFPSLLIRVHGWSPASVGGILGLYSVPCGAFSSLGAGWAAAWLQRRGRQDAAIIVALAGTAWVAAMGVIATLVDQPNLEIVFYCLLSLGINCSPVATLTALNRVTPNELRGQVIALFTMSTGLIALSLGSFAVGFLSDNLYGPSQGIGESLATVLAAAGVLAFIVLAAARRRYRAIAGPTLIA